MNVIEKGLNFLRSYSMRVPAWIRLLVILGALVMPIYWAATNTGMYAAIAEWQASWNNGEHYLIVSFMLPVLFFLIPGLAIILVIGQFFPEVDPKKTNTKL